MIKTKFDLLKEWLVTLFGPHIGAKIAEPLWQVCQIKRKVHASIRYFNETYYETRIAPHLARTFPWFFWPAYKVFAIFHICFVVNIADGTGHIIAELDYFFRRLELGQIDRNKRYVWLKKSRPISRACVALYKHRFWFSIANDFVYNLLLPVTVKYKSITIDCGLSRLKWQLPENANDIGNHPPDPGQTYLYQISKAEGLRQTRAYFYARAKSSSYYPLKGARFSGGLGGLYKLLKGRTDKLALIHVKYDVKNATVKPTDPVTYLESLDYLRGLRYQLVFVGREKMPDEFKAYNAINYAESDSASFKNDIAIFAMAEMAIIAGSGISYLADCLGKPFVYINYWHLERVPFPKYCVCSPTLVQKPSGLFFTFAEQIALHNTLPDIGDEVLPNQYKALNAGSDEILAAVKELIELKDHYKPRSDYQEQFMSLCGKSSRLFLSQSRVSDYFLNKYKDFL